MIIRQNILDLKVIRHVYTVYYFITYLFLGRIIQKRWRSIRDSFMKAYKKMNKNQSKKSAAKRKRYVYFDQMMFIIPSIEKRK